MERTMPKTFECQEGTRLSRRSLHGFSTWPAATVAGALGLASAASSVDLTQAAPACGDQWIGRLAGLAGRLAGVSLALRHSMQSPVDWC